MRDAGPPPDARVGIRSDAGLRPPVLDGVITDEEWSGGVTEVAEVPTNREGSTLTSLRAVVVDDRLFVGVESTLAVGDMLLVYVDGELGASEGVADFGSLIDGEGPLDAALSTPLFVPSNVAIDVAFGTNLVPTTVVEPGDRAGWRVLGSGGFERLSGEEAALACGAGACEASIALTNLSGERPRTIAVFARIVTAEGLLTNQTLPADDAEAPDTVSRLLTLDDGVVSLDDAGVDGGESDGGPGWPVLDGVLDPGEWSGAVVSMNSVPATGAAFDGCALESIRLLRGNGQLYVAIEGTLVGDNAVLMFVDADVGGGEGVVDTTALSDYVGALDSAFSRQTLFPPSVFRFDYGWGTLDMPLAAPIDEGRVGWRALVTGPAPFTPVNAAAAPTACALSVCETSIPLATLGVGSTDTVGVFVRLTAAQLDLVSNQSLPTALDAETFTEYLELAP